jgi:DNA-binding CsgD family transcriptional regulator
LAESAHELPGLAYANLAFLLGGAELARGDVGRAVTLLHEALAGVERHRVITGLRSASRFALVEAHAKLGQAAESAALLNEARVCVPEDYRFMHTGLAVATGWSLAANGFLAEAVSTVLAAADIARDRRQPTHEVACLQAATQWGDTSTAERARELADMLSLPLADAVAQHAEASAAHDGDALLAASAAYRDLGDRATAADAAAQAADAFTRAQSRRRGLFAAAIAKELATECGGLSTPALRTPASNPLTGRQREIAEMVAAGLPNRDIATRLVMSVRSVEGHIYRACQRVGASSREELADILRKGLNGA